MPLTPTNDIVYGDILNQIQPLLVSGTNIKTINNTSILGTGDLTINTTTAAWGNITGTLADQTDLQNALDLKADLVGGIVPSFQLPSFVDEVLEYANLAAFPVTGASDKIYIALDTNLTYRWAGTVYAVLNPSLALGETIATAYRGDRGKIAYDHSQITSGNPHNTAIADISGLQTALNSKVNTTSLATVATSGSYTDLINKPSIPDGQVNSDWNANSGVAQILNKPIVPSNLSQLNNDIGFVTGGYVSTAISTKQDTLVSGTNIKTINGNSLLGSGDLVISGGGGGGATWGSIIGTLSSQTDLQSALNAKQNTLTLGNVVETVSSVLTITGGTGAVVGSGVAIQVKQATTSQSGFLSSTDWNTFNSKQSPITTGNLTEVASSVLNITGGTGAIIGSGVTVQVKQATTSQSGFLSSTDWNTFNGKQNALTLGNIFESISNVLLINGGTNAVIGNTGVSIQARQAGSTQPGFLSTIDWNTFNNKAKYPDFYLRTGTGETGATFPAGSPAVVKFKPTGPLTANLVITLLNGTTAGVIHRYVFNEMAITDFTTNSRTITIIDQAATLSYTIDSPTIAEFIWSGTAWHKIM